MDIVYTVKKDKNNDELRYSLRSLQNLSHDRVWIVGEIPDWVVNVNFLPNRRSPSPWDSVHSNLTKVCSEPDLSSEFIFFNDDFFVMKNFDIIPAMHSGKLSSLANLYSRSARNSYASRLLYTSNMLGEKALNYELHVPMVFKKSVLPQYIKVARRGLIRSVYGNKMRIGGEVYKDVKVRSSKHPTPAPTADDILTSPFISTSNTSFSQHFVGDFIRSSFPDKSIYER